MENQSPQFRTAAFGGFQKQDVLNYLEKAAKDHADKLADLQKRLKEATEGQVEMEAQEAADQIRVAELESANSQLSVDLDAATKRCNDLEAQLTALRAEMEQIAPAAEAYRDLKDRAASIELTAHVRAQAIEEASQRKAEKTVKEVVAWIDQVQGAYANLHLSLNAALSSAAEELRKTKERVQETMGSEDLLETRQPLKPLEQKPFSGIRTGGETGGFGGTMPPAGPSPFTK